MEGIQAHKMKSLHGVGVLYIVGTPIGNLGDITPRAKEILTAIDVVVCEDTRRTSHLLAAIGAKARLISCFEHKEARCTKEVLGLLLEGVDCAFLTDAGTPNVSDPGRRLIGAAFENGIKVIPIPGPSAVTTIMSCAPFVGDSFYFAGFLPEKANKRRRELEKIGQMTCPVIFFEAPHRVIDSLIDVLMVLGDRRILMGRELTKMHEEVHLTTVSKLIDHLESRGARGEFTFCLDGTEATDRKSHGGVDEKKLEDLMLLINAFQGERVHTKSMASALSRLTGIKKGLIYEMLLTHLKDEKSGEGGDI